MYCIRKDNEEAKPSPFGSSMGARGACRVQEGHGQEHNEARTANTQTRNHDHLDDRHEYKEISGLNAQFEEHPIQLLAKQEGVHRASLPLTSSRDTRDHHGLSYWQCCEEIAVGVHHEERETTPKDNGEGRSGQLVDTALKLYRCGPDHIHRKLEVD